MNEILKGTNNREEHDFYATHPKHVKEIIDLENIKNLTILEPCAGEGHISKELAKYNNCVVSNDLIQRDFYLNFNVDYLKEKITLDVSYDLVLTNPPFKYAREFIEKSLVYADTVIIFARLQLLESTKRKELMENHLEKVYVYSQRAKCAKGGLEIEFDKSSSMAFAWFVFKRNKTNETVVRWI